VLLAASTESSGKFHGVIGHRKIQVSWRPRGARLNEAFNRRPAQLRMNAQLPNTVEIGAGFKALASRAARNISNRVAGASSGKIRSDLSFEFMVNGV
jgi:hypothetical protein